MIIGGRLARWAAAALLLVPASAIAQQEEPIGPIAIDVRGIFARHKQEPSVATDLGVTAANLPSKSFGLTTGVHWYPFHLGVITFGIGGHLLTGRGSETLEPKPSSGSGTTTPSTPSPTIVRHFRVLTPDLSLNFGHRYGWSYLSAGLGTSTLFVERKDQPVADPPARKTIHYGGGARWFVNHHLAVSLDFRWYAVSPQDASATGGVAQPRTTLLVLSGGVALR